MFGELIISVVYSGLAVAGDGRKTVSPDGLDGVVSRSSVLLIFAHALPVLATIALPRRMSEKKSG